MNPPELNTPRLVLRLPTAEDVPEVVRFYDENREHLAPWWPRRSADFFLPAAHAGRVLQALSDFERGSAVRLLVFDRSSPGGVIGLVNFNDIIRGAAQVASVGYALDGRAQGQGLMTEALQPAIAYMFESHNLHRITANYIPHNVRSGAVLRRLGFVVEGYARDYLLIDGKWRDHILTGLVNPNWELPNG